MDAVRHDGATTFHDAFDHELGRKVTLITSPAGPDLAEAGRLAFRLPRMRHANIVSALAAGVQGKVAFVAADVVETEPLSAFLARAGRLPVYQGLAFVLQLLSALDHAHARRMVHADIDVDHVQVTRTGQLKLSASGWSLASDRQPNLEAAARTAQVLLSGVCSPRMRQALDEVLLRAGGSDPEARYRDADTFSLALMAAAGLPAWTRAPVLERAVPPEPESVLLPVPVAMPAPVPTMPVAVSIPDVMHATEHAARRPMDRHRLGRNLMAACLAAALLAPNLIRNNSITGKDVVPPRVAMSPEASPAPAAPARVAFSPPPASAVETLPDPPPAVAPPATAPAIQPEPAPRRLARPPQQTARNAVAPPAARARPAPSVRHAQVATAATTRPRPARPRAAATLTAASGCPYDLRIARDLCEAQQCMRPELRNTPLCMRMLAEQRAALARLRGTPD